MTARKTMVGRGDEPMVNFDRHCAQILAKTAALTSYLDHADLGRPVPTCPGWNASQLLRHVDGGLRWAADIVDTRATTPPSDVALRDLSAATDQDPTLLSTSLSEAAERLAAILTEAGPSARMWGRSREQTAAKMRGPVTDLLLTMYRRLPIGSSRVEVTGDGGLVDFWLERVGFG